VEFEPVSTGGVETGVVETDVDTDVDAPAGTVDAGFGTVDADIVGADIVEAGEVDDEVDTGLVDRIEEDLADVERALARLDDGTYGRCEVCGDTLSDDELARSPATRFCRAHLPLSLS
jgi:hypothetical protein